MTEGAAMIEAALSGLVAIAVLIWSDIIIARRIGSLMRAELAREGKRESEGEGK